MEIRIQVEEQDEQIETELQTPEAMQTPPDIWRVQRVLQDAVRRLGWSIGVTGGAFAIGGALLALLPALLTGGFREGTFSTGLFAVGNIAVGGCAMGNLAIGGVAWGNLALGLIAVGNAAGGLLLAIGNAAVGAVAVGNGALGLLAVGNGARGVIAIGQNARGVVAIGQRAKGVFVLARRGEGQHVLDAERQDEKAVAFFTRRLPRLRPAFGQPEQILADPLKRDPARKHTKELYERFLHSESDEGVISEAVAMGEPIVPTLVQWLIAWQPRVRARATEALKRIGGQVVSQHLQAVLMRKHTWRDKWMWLRGRTPSQDELMFTLAEIADATGDLILLEQLLKRLKSSALVDIRYHNVWVRVGMGLAHHATPEKLDLLVEPFAYYLRLAHIDHSRRSIWLPPNHEMSEFLESTLSKLETCAMPDTLGVLAMAFQRAYPPVNFRTLQPNEYWAEPEWREATDSSQRMPPVKRLHAALTHALSQLETANETVLSAEATKVMHNLMQLKSEPELQIVLASTAPYWGDKQTVDVLERMTRQSGIKARLRETIELALIAMPARLERLRDRRTLMRTVHESAEARSLMRAADQVNTDIPTEQLMRVSMGDDVENSS
jgi:hypothetical protein